MTKTIPTMEKTVSDPEIHPDDVDDVDEFVSTSGFDNSHIWSLQKAIAKELSPILRGIQNAWANREQLNHSVCPLDLKEIA